MSSLPCTIARRHLRRGNGPRAYIFLNGDAQREGRENKQDSLIYFQEEVDKKNPRLWLKMKKWYDRIHWVSSEFKSEVGCYYAARY